MSVLTSDTFNIPARIFIFDDGVLIYTGSTTASCNCILFVLGFKDMNSFLNYQICMKDNKFGTTDFCCRFAENKKYG